MTCRSYYIAQIRRGLSNGSPSINQTKVTQVNKPKSRLASTDPRKDFKYFVMRAKVCQVYREALIEARQFSDLQMKSEMSQMIQDEFRVFRRDPADLNWKLDSGKIDYHLALIRKQINMIKELRDRVA
ncbi:hypothetical protein FGO68_gene2092 [Halteria grandinella]|uniref:Complex 1 LYR protein domain-containing protein n=1 Tax=Halteria grandinella TaxID=5974 RepID=A0A8J8P809_HALGN|nr:hypothetical protein FGO68_gene2092 [Halteria grandinella]